MLYIITAMYAEAAPFIKHYNLKRDRLMKRHELYASEQGDILLLITKPGKIAAAIAVTELLVTHVPTRDDYLVNIGVCGSTEVHTFAVTSAGTDVASSACSVADSNDDTSVYICTDILDHDTGRHYYPDMIFNHPFRESGIETCSVVINDKSLVSMPLVDMEASAIYQAASSFFSPHRMSFLKIPSDKLETSRVTMETVTRIIENALSTICEWLDSLSKYAASDNIYLKDFSATSDSTGLELTTPTCRSNAKLELTSAEQSLFDDLSAKLNLSVTMKEQLHQFFIYRKLTKGSLDGIVLPDIPEGRITNQKRTILFEQFRQQFL